MSGLFIFVFCLLFIRAVIFSYCSCQWIQKYDYGSFENNDSLIDQINIDLNIRCRPKRLANRPWEKRIEDRYYVWGFYGQTLLFIDKNRWMSRKIWTCKT